MEYARSPRDEANLIFTPLPPTSPIEMVNIPKWVDSPLL